MTRYFIEDAKSRHRRDFGPHAIVASAVKYKEDNGETKWIYYISECGPMIAVYGEDIFEQILEIKFPEDLNSVDSFGGLSWEGLSEEALFELFDNNKNNGVANLIHYVYDLGVCDKNEEKELLSLGIGHYSDEIEVPILDEEQWWLDNPEE